MSKADSHNGLFGTKVGKKTKNRLLKSYIYFNLIKMLFPIFNVSRMMLYDFTPQHTTVDVHIYFRSGNAFMTQHTLYGAEVSTSFKKVCGE